MPLYQQDLNQMPCGKCGKIACEDGDDVMLKPMCHPDAGHDVDYNRTTGALTIKCSECKRFVADVMVAEDPNKPGRN